MNSERITGNCFFPDGELSTGHYWNIDARQEASTSDKHVTNTTKRRKQNLSSYGRSQNQAHAIFESQTFESELPDDLDAVAELSGLSLVKDRDQLSTMKIPCGQNVELRHVDITSEDPFGIRGKCEERTKKSKKNGGKMKSTFDDLSLDELRHYRRLSGNTLWSLVQKRKMGCGPSWVADDTSGILGGSGGVPMSSLPQSAGVSSGGMIGSTGVIAGNATSYCTDKAMNKRLQQLWGCLPEKERRVWKSKAKRIMKQLQVIQRKEASQAAAGKQIPPDVVRQKERQRITNRVAGLKVATFNIGDLAAHIKIVGDGLYSIGRNITIQNTPVAVHGTESVLLDSLVCTLPPLIALCNQISVLKEAIDKREMCETLDSLSYFMPGLY